jgi:hypothetical protein
VSTRVRTAASSIASGSPSSRWHSSTTAAWLASVSSKPPEAAAARSANSVTVSLWRSRASGTVASAGGSSSGGTGTTCSPGADSGSRLVAIIRTPGAARRISVRTRAAAESRCSQLSTTSSSRLSRR